MKASKVISCEGLRPADNAVNNGRVYAVWQRVVVRSGYQLSVGDRLLIVHFPFKLGIPPLLTRVVKTLNCIAAC